MSSKNVDAARKLVANMIANTDANSVKPTITNPSSKQPTRPKTTVKKPVQTLIEEEESDEEDSDEEESDEDDDLSGFIVGDDMIEYDEELVEVDDDDDESVDGGAEDVGNYSSKEDEEKLKQSEKALAKAYEAEAESIKARNHKWHGSLIDRIAAKCLKDDELKELGYKGRPVVDPTSNPFRRVTRGKKIELKETQEDMDTESDDDDYEESEEESDDESEEEEEVKIPQPKRRTARTENMSDEPVVKRVRND